MMSGGKDLEGKQGAKTKNGDVQKEKKTPRSKSKELGFQ